MIRIVVIAIAITAIGSTILLYRSLFSQSNLNNEVPLSPTVGTNSEATISGTPTLEALTPTIKPTLKPTNETATPRPTNKPTESSNNNWYYPGASVVSSSGNSATLSTGTDPDAVTDWYKNKIKERGMNTTSFVTTKTNNNVLNKLAGSGNGQNISVEIKRDAGSSITQIALNW